jgi:hypothetical protein
VDLGGNGGNNPGNGFSETLGFQSFLKEEIYIQCVAMEM